MNEPCHRRLSNSSYLSWGRKSTKWLKIWRQVFCNQSKVEGHGDRGLFSSAAAVVHSQSWAAEETADAACGSLKLWTNLTCRARGGIIFALPSLRSRLPCLYVSVFVLFPPADQQTLPMKTVDMAAFSKQSFFLWHHLKKLLQLQHLPHYVFAARLLVCLRNWNRPLQLFWPEFTFFTDGWTSNEMGTCQCVEMSEW